ncbi:MAG: hypothetical protein J7619_01600 [Dyadobacter sp.]|uniref:hypothetical protein n=1 Tax=Dyadobacter sp. TaxID=1914288 RepID=UPI001B273163|nr:hypothetical protein [Dyadobacter sp.]MBO9611355.1 hypothetical protein [Dyadobacter sp.]
MKILLTRIRRILVSALMLSATFSFAQVKIGTNPTTIEPASNLEVEAATTGRKVKVDKTTGQLTIKDGTEGADKILTSDAVGGASWKTPGTLKLDQTVFVGRQSGVYTVTTFNNVFNALKDRIPLDVQSGSLTGWNAATKQYVIQESGNYRIFTGAALTGTLAPPQVTVGAVYLWPFQVLNKYDGINNLVGPVLSEFWEAHLDAGAVVDLYVTSNPLTGGAQNINVQNGFLTIVKLAY